MADQPITPQTSLQNPTTVLLWSAGRALEIWAGMRIAGQKDRPVARAIWASLAVQGAIYVWANLKEGNKVSELPSILAVRENKLVDMFLSYLMRAGIMAGGMWIGGFRKNIIRDGLAGSAVTEATVIALQGNVPRLPEAPA